MDSNNILAKAEPLFDLQRIGVIDFLFRNKHLILIPWLLVLGLSGLLVFLAPPVYSTQAKMLVKINQQGQPSLLSGIAAYRDANEFDQSSRKLETEMEILASSQVIGRVIKELNIRSDDLYHPPLQHLVLQLKQFIRRAMGSGRNPEIAAEDDMDQRINTLAKSLVVRLVKSRNGEINPNIVEVKLSMSNPQLIGKTLAQILKRHSEYAASLDQASAGQARQVVMAELAKSSKLVESNQSRLRSVMGRSARTGSPTGDNAPGDLTVSQLRQRVTQMEIDLAEARKTYTDNADNVKTLVASLSELKRLLETEQTRAASTETAYMDAQRQLRIEEELEQDLRRKLRQIDVLMLLNPALSTMRVVLEAPAAPRGQEWMPRVLILIIGGVAGLFIGLLMALLRESMEDRFISADHVEKTLGMPVIGSVPMLTAETWA